MTLMSTFSDFGEFLSVIAKGDVEEVKRRCRHDYLNMRNEAGQTALHCACNSGNADLVGYLLNEGWDIDSEDNNKRRPLHLAARRFHNAIKRILIDSGCRLDDPNKSLASFICLYKSPVEDRELLKFLRSVDHTRCSPTRRLEISLLLEEIVAIFDGEYWEVILAKFKSKEYLKSYENSKSNALTLSLTLLGQFNIESTRQSIFNIFIKYLTHLSDVSHLDYVARRMSQELLLGLYCMSRYGCVEFSEETASLLRKYYKGFSKNDAIKIPTAYMLILLVNREKCSMSSDDDITRVAKYLKEIVEQAKTTKSNIISDIFIGPDEQCEMLCMIKELTTPCLKCYEKKEFLGRGTFGDVFKGFDKTKNVYFVIKEVLFMSQKKFDQDSGVLENEINILKKCKDHIRIVQYFGSEKTENGTLIFMEYMSGGSLKDKLVIGGPLTFKEIGQYTKQILEGLEFLHHHHIIHRDIKSANILLDEYCNIKLCDFGISRVLLSKTFQNANQNNTEMANTNAGTANWMAPEILRKRKYNEKVDIWSLGATVVEMLTGHPPYHGFGLYALCYEVVITQKAVYTSPENTPVNLQSLIDLMFCPEASNRPHAKELLQWDFNFE